MRRQFDFKIQSWTLAAPFRIARGVRMEAEVIELKLREGDLEVLAECTPTARYGESLESVSAQLLSLKDAVEQGLTREVLQSRLPAGAARNGLDNLLWNLEAKQSQKSVSALLGTSELTPLLSVQTISIDSPENMQAAARALSHLKALKIKLGPNQPAACLRAVRLGSPDASLVVDANEGWDLETTIAMQPVLLECDVKMLEQPLPAAEDWQLKGLKALVPLCADESCHVTEDLEGLTDRYQMINIKLDKTGGLTEALRLLKRARELDLGVMVGCMLATSLGIAPGFHVARWADFIDLDGPILIKHDRSGGVQMREGLLHPPSSQLWG